MLRLYFYQIDRQRGYSIGETGTHYQITDEPMNEGHYNDRNYDEDCTLLCSFCAHSFDNHRFQLLENGEWYGTYSLHGKHHSLFTVKECAAFLDISERRVQALIKPKEGMSTQISARKRGRDYLIAGSDLVAFAGKERPAHRPRKKKLPKNIEDRHFCGDCRRIVSTEDWIPAGLCCRDCNQKRAEIIHSALIRDSGSETLS